MTGVFFDWSNGYIARYAEGTSHKSTGDEICSLDGVGWQKGGRAGGTAPSYRGEGFDVICRCGGSPRLFVRHVSLTGNLNIIIKTNKEIITWLRI